jgi:hypothetical protein
VFKKNPTALTYKTVFYVILKIYYINVNVAKLGSKAGNFLTGKREREGERDKGDR